MGALSAAQATKFFSLQNTIRGVTAPESCAPRLSRDESRKRKKTPAKLNARCWTRSLTLHSQ